MDKKALDKNEVRVTGNPYFAKFLTKYFEDNPEVKQLIQSIFDGLRKANDFLKQPHVQNFLLKLVNLPEKRKIAVQEMSDRGWFPNKYCFFNYPDEDQSIDDFMSSITNDKYQMIKSDTLESFPDRELILTNAFELYEKKNYIACIPLFLTQIDGICDDSGLNHYFTDKYVGNKKDKGKPEFKKFPIYVKELMGKQDIDEDVKDFFNVIVEKADKAFISLSTHKIDEINELTILNRHGILHGLKEFSEYGTEINAKKVLSLMCYIILMIELFFMDAES